VTVQLFLDANGDGQLTGAEQSWIAERTSDASGFYLFAEQTHSGGTALGSPVPLYPGQYIVGVAPNNFLPAGPLAGYYSSATTISNAGAITEIAAPDSNNDTDRDDNGAMVRGATLFYNGGVLSTPVFVDDNEPTGEPESAGTAPGGLTITDNRSNLTVDFGFYTASLGNLVWVDDGVGGGTAVNGLRDGAEVGLAGVTVSLYRPGSDGTAGTADVVLVASTVIGTGGTYLFDNLDGLLRAVRPAVGLREQPTGHRRQQRHQRHDRQRCRCYHRTHRDHHADAWRE
jgi:hypothetical protein